MRSMKQLREQKEIQRALEEKLHSMTQSTIGLPTEAPTTPRVSTRGSCSVVDPTEYSDQYELLVDGNPPRIVAVGRVLEEGQIIRMRFEIPRLRYMEIVIVNQGRSSMYEFVEPQTIQPSGNTIESKQNYLQTWMTKSNRDVYFVPYIDGGYYVMSWIKTIIRAAITDDWIERFKSTSSIPEDAIKKIRQEWTTYLLQRWT
ncbi:hypothetical protein LR48_Vigan08g030600 [Vigna angularis]|uniref:Uncharacterized protein n=1 Tax=Phaseolus angularis TaxID=3914 RepID=A0A0L9V467_PHAAN|nr:hypothetical protein LR48_Vigan08g030600 [Vigna angularis]